MNLLIFEIIYLLKKTVKNKYLIKFNKIILLSITITIFFTALKGQNQYPYAYYNNEYNGNKKDFRKEFYNFLIKNSDLRNDLEDYFMGFDFSNILMDTTKNEVFEKSIYNGTVSNKYNRIMFHFDSINKKDDTIYAVYGKYKFKNKVNMFSGDLIITNIIKDTTCDCFYKDEKKFNNIYKIIFNYHFLDFKPKKKNEFLGIGFILGCKNNSGYENIETAEYCECSDQTFVGLFINKSLGIIEKCIWGRGALPFTFDFMSGDGSITINKKYINNGWKSFQDGSEFLQINLWKSIYKDKWWEDKKK